jgi:inositol oxygenase
MPQHKKQQHVLHACCACMQEDWLHLTALIHDLGKVLAHPKFGSQPQWAVVGDTFPTGCAHDPRLVYHQYFAANPDAADPQLSGVCGVYEAGCGLDKVTMSWGHDEYLHMVSTSSTLGGGQ